MRKMPRMLLCVALIASVAAGIVGCDGATATEGECTVRTAGTCYFYQAFGEGGALGAQGYVSLQEEVLQGEVWAVQGVWQIGRVDASVEVGGQVGTGVLGGTRRGDEFVVSLHPELPAGGVELVGTVEADEITGIWVGDDPQGTPVTGEFRAQEVE